MNTWLKVSIVIERIILSAMFFISFASPSVYASIQEFEYGNNKDQYITDSELKNVAIKNHIIPKNAGKIFFKKEIKNKNTITTWIMMDRKSKLLLIEKLRDIYKNNGVIVRLPSEYYIVEINGVIYNSILKKDIISDTKKGVGHIFKTIAIMEGDYDSGKDKVIVAKEYMGEQIFQQYKTMYPEKYKRLIRK